jgi:hypothetical protein
MPWRDPIWDDLAALAFELLARRDYRAPLVAEMRPPEETETGGGRAMSLALIYVRQSDHKRYERTTSPEVQREACLSLPAVKACDQVEVFEDLGVSGGKLKGRKGFDALMKRIEAAQVEVVAVYDQSRAVRNTRDALDFFALMDRRTVIAPARGRRRRRTGPPAFGAYYQAH